MRVGFIPADDASSGGMFQYSNAISASIARLALESSIPSPTILARGKAPKIDETLRVVSLDSPSTHAVKRILRGTLPPGIRGSALRLSPVRRGGADQVVAPRPEIARRLKGLGIDVLLFPGPDVLASESGFPSIMAIHDLQHRLQPEFPEVSRRGEWQAREYIYRNAARETLLMLVDSEVGKQDVLDLYGEHGATQDRVKILPFVASPGLRTGIAAADVSATVSRFKLPDRFLLYPAQFWPHKNHLRIVEALGAIADRDVHVVFCGSNSGSLRKRTFREAMRRAAELRVMDRVHYLGYVSDDVLSALYASAVALVFPTFFGPTNIPVIEAWNFGVPVLTSRIRGITEQVGDAGLLVDPRSVEEMAAGMDRLWTDADLRISLIEAGNRRLSLYTPEDHRDRLGEILAEAAARLDA